MSAIEIRAYCWGCGDPVMDDEVLVIATDGNDYHEECIIDYETVDPEREG